MTGLAANNGAGAESPKSDYDGVPGGGPVAWVRGREIKLVGSLRSHKRLAVVVFLLVLILGAPMAWEKGQHLYFSEAVIHVSPRFSRILETDREHVFHSNIQYRQFVEQQVRTIENRAVAEKALEVLGHDRERYWPTVGSPAETVRRLQAELVRSIPDTYLIAIGLVGQSPDGLAPVVNAVAEAYLAKAKENEFFASDDIIESLKREQRLVRQSAEKKSELRLHLAERLGLTVFETKTMNPFDEIVNRTRLALADARQASTRAAASLYAVDPKRGKRGEELLTGFAMEYVVKDYGLNSLQAELNKRNSLLVTKLSGMAEGHPGRQNVEVELGKIQAAIEKARGLVYTQFKRMILDQRRAAVEESKRVEQELERRLDALRSKGVAFAKDYQEGLELGVELEDMRERLRTIRRRISNLERERRAPGFVRLDQRAVKPDVPYKGGRKKSFLFLLAVAGFFAIITPLGVDILWRRVHAASDVMRILGFPPMGWVLDRISPRTWAFAEDQSIRLASTLQRHCAGASIRSLTFTSVKPGGGATTLALELAGRLNELGTRTVVLEANAFKPDVRYLTEPPTPGLLDVIDEGLDLRDAIVPADEVLPDRIGVGSVGDARHLPHVTRVGPVIDELTSLYDLVIVDAPPILISADAELLTALSNGTLLIVEAEGVGQGEVRRASRTLDSLDLDAVGAIVNRVRVYGGSGYMSELLEEYQTGQKRKCPKWMPSWLWR